MPTSEHLFDKAVVRLFKDWSYRLYLDLGAGSGKYAKLIAEAHQGDPPVIEAVEPDADYVERFKLNELYERPVNISTALDFLQGHKFGWWEVAILGDVIEHMRKSHGLDVLHELLYRTHRILLVFPVRYPQPGTVKHPLERHRSAWSEHDFAGMTYMMWARKHLRLVVVEGYLSTKEPLVSAEFTEHMRAWHEAHSG